VVHTSTHNQSAPSSGRLGAGPVQELSAQSFAAVGAVHSDLADVQGGSAASARSTARALPKGLMVRWLPVPENAKSHASPSTLSVL
jgi:hypothetical protein